MISAAGLLLCTDLDRTLLPNGSQAESPGARTMFRALAAEEDVVLVYVSGRDRALVEQAIVSYTLPVPDWVVSDVGTCIYQIQAGVWIENTEWDASIAADWNHRSHRQLFELLAGLTALRPQERSKQGARKLSYYVPLHMDRAALDAEIDARLRAHGVRASLIWSVDEPAGVGLLDVLPAGATKLHALRFLRELLGFATEQVYFAGDSGNDLDVLASEVPACLVANAVPSVAAAATAAAEARGNRDQLYLARGGFLAMNGNYAAGLLEGVAHFHPQRAAALGRQNAAQGFGAACRDP